MRRERQKRIFLAAYHYLCFFLVMAFVISCSMIVFVKTLQDRLGFEFTKDMIQDAAVLTFVNVVILAFVCTAVDVVRRHYMVDRPVKEIVKAAEKLMRGDFTARVPALPGMTRAAGLDEIAACMNQMAVELGSMESLRTDFVANVSHELKTPLSVMQNYGTLLQQDNLSGEQRMDYAKAITESSRRLAQLITNILKLNKLENQTLALKRQTYNLTEQVCACLLDFENAWDAKQIEIETDLEEDIVASSDPELLSLVWNNLFSNAIKFTEPGGTVRLRAQRDGDCAVVSVSDTGCGMTQEVSRHIFEKFFQGDTSHATQGNGLGLALVKRVVDMLGGRITVTSAVGEGSTFTVRIRLDGGKVPYENTQVLPLPEEKGGNKGLVVALIMGICGTLMLGTGLSFALVWTDSLFAPGIVIGVIGIAGICAAYPLHQKLKIRS